MFSNWTSPRVNFPMRFSMTSCRGFAVSKQCAYSFALFLKGLYTKKPMIFCSLLPPQKKTMKNYCPQRKTRTARAPMLHGPPSSLRATRGSHCRVRGRECQFFFEIFGQKNPLTYPIASWKWSLSKRKATFQKPPVLRFYGSLLIGDGGNNMASTFTKGVSKHVQYSEVSRCLFTLGQGLNFPWHITVRIFAY